MPAAEPLRVTAVGLRALAADCAAAASALSNATPPADAPVTGMASDIATACAGVVVRCAAAQSALSGWAGTFGTALSAAASAYDGTDATSAAALSGQVT